MIQNYRDILDKYKSVKVLIIGDLMLDRYWWGTVSRISPEAPVPVVSLEKETLIAGGAANVAANIKGLGATPFLVGVVGDDSEGILLIETLHKLNIDTDSILKVKNRPTTVKTRIIAHHQQVSRIDQETIQNLSKDFENLFFSFIEPKMSEINVVIISDYAKGVLSDDLLLRLIKLCKAQQKLVIVDPKGLNYSKYNGADILTPNKKEVLEAGESSELDFAVQNIFKNKIQTLLVTQGEDGMTIYEKEGEKRHLNALARHVYDVTGAGDTVIATIAVSLGAGADLFTAASIANKAAGFVVEEIGTTAIDYNKLIETEI